MKNLYTLMGRTTHKTHETLRSHWSSFGKAMFLSIVFALSLTNSFSQTFSIVGAGTASNSTTSYPAPYGNYYWGARHQFLVTAAELSAAGIAAGSSISSLGFNVTADNGATSHTGFQVVVFSTTLANPLATAYVTTGQVAASAVSNYNPAAGWNQHSFTPFVWDGTSNLVVQTCFNNGDLYDKCVNTVDYNFGWYNH